MSREKGAIYEQQAIDFLKNNGYEILEQNFYSRFGEIDIIAKKDRILHFVEVKGGESFDPIYAITPSKLLKIFKTINFYLYKNHLSAAYCVDAVIISHDEIRFVENITL